MARTTTSVSINAVIDDAVQAVVARVLPSLQRAFNAAVDARLRAESSTASARRGRRGRPTRRPGELTRWVADNSARRVPTFVIDATGLDTKNKVVAKYGPNAAFTKGKPLPPVKLESANKTDARAKAPREVKAKPPIVRKAAAAK
jgi:hypothetical protein